MINTNMIITLIFKQTSIINILFSKKTFLCMVLIACNICSVDTDVSLFSSIASYRLGGTVLPISIINDASSRPKETMGVGVVDTNTDLLLLTLIKKRTMGCIESKPRFAFQSKNG